MKKVPAWELLVRKGFFNDRKEAKIIESAITAMEEITEEPFKVMISLRANHVFFPFLNLNIYQFLTIALLNLA